MSQEKHWGKDPIIGTADTRARTEEALPTDPEVILREKRRKAEAAVEFDRLYRDSEVVRVQSIIIRGLQESRDRLDRRCKGLEDRLVKLEEGTEVAREESDARIRAAL